jgi:NhaP-type Na+/H+ or K+/H+ antiporter/mannitol/fructose-specific phosphotransferase system IIA component (Ntr-type)
MGYNPVMQTNSIVEQAKGPALTMLEQSAHHGMELKTTFVGALVFGVIFIVLSKKMRTSAIAVLLLGGIALGPEWLGIINPDALGPGLETIISLAVGIVLFEGGLTLNAASYRKVSRVIRGLLTKGVLITWLLSTVMLTVLFKFDITFSVLAASLIIVTGPTVIAPLLKRTRVRENLHTILHWEGVLIDPIGVFISLLCYEWYISGSGEALANFGVRFLIGTAYGVAGGLIIALVLRRKWIPNENLNIFVLAGALAVFTLSDMVLAESGLLAVTVAGFLVGHLARQHIEGLKTYKAELIELLIGLLFVLLAARLDLSSFTRHGNLMLIAIFIVMFIVRPINIFVSAYGSKLTLKEKLFLCWIAPRGIVAASMASLFALNLAQRPNEPNADFLQAFTFSIIAATILFQGLTAGFVGKLLGVLEPKARGWLIIGAHALGRRVASIINDEGVNVVMMDTNGRHVSKARREGLTALCVNAMTVETSRYPELYGIGHILAITENKDLNTLLSQKWLRDFPRAKAWKWGENLEGDDAGHVLQIGSAIWQGVNLEKLHAFEEDDVQNRVSIVELPPERIHHHELVLATIYHGGVYAGFYGEGDEVRKFVVFHPLVVRLDLQIKPEWVNFSDKTTITDALEDMLALVKEEYPELDNETLHQQLIKQGEEYSSLIGYGFSLPHTYTDTIEESLVVVCKLREKVTCLHSGEEVKFIFMVLSPRGKPQHHLKALSEISRFIMNDDNRDMLLSATDDDSLREVFFQDEP